MAIAEPEPPRESPVPEPRWATRELRLAIVCYGGVSLAIYMHGVTKEIHKLVLASAALEGDPDNNPFDEDTTERVYWDVLSRISKDGLGGHAKDARMRVVVDIITGTSAGGINGIFLAKALTGNRPQDGLRKLWFEKGDIKHLLEWPTWIPWQLRFLAMTVARRKPPLRGGDMSKWLYGALRDMNGKQVPDGAESLLPDDHVLDLYVPITDFLGYERDIPLYDPRFIRDRGPPRAGPRRGVPDQPQRDAPAGRPGSEGHVAVPLRRVLRPRRPRGRLPVGPARRCRTPDQAAARRPRASAHAGHRRPSEAGAAGEARRAGHRVPPGVPGHPRRGGPVVAQRHQAGDQAAGAGRRPGLGGGPHVLTVERSRSTPGAGRPVGRRGQPSTGSPMSRSAVARAARSRRAVPGARWATTPRPACPASSTVSSTRRSSHASQSSRRATVQAAWARSGSSGGWSSAP
ncbi:MAG: hypothetical protein AVDCRST_MAG10-1541 [uncultured Acidimicrobiales bacterium]|uniref:PNPLA domain-containing protein n=1 Tax=uncultured Acidimicrobiales bacterium TaxID=310071 RepID=A0A6J4HWL6_9ACTN|nr:MAG: hypothetical protein AVDCRST_MAG10-1541 [uncultured Acidimicrobiales bacterium]